jgi:type II secretory pathway pseudopilin PulG
VIASIRYHDPMNRKAITGFSLVELAIAIFIMALLLGSILVPLQSQVRSRKLDETDRILEQSRDALLGYVVANGRFPCPAAPGGNGQETFAAGGSAANGNCSNFFNGFLPATTLGMAPLDTNGYLLDSWAGGSTQSRIHYAVSSNTIATVTNPFTKTNGMRLATMGSIMDSSISLLFVCNSGGGGAMTSNCGTSTILADHAIAVIFSLGENAATGGTSTDESKNVDNNRVFVQAGYQPTFDDQLTWIGPPILFNRMVAAGMLP